MNDNLEITTTINSVAFLSKNIRFTYAQLKLIQLCNKNLASKEVITYQEMRRFWLNNVMTDRWVNEWNVYRTVKLSKSEIITYFDKDDTYFLTGTVLPWFRQNIGSLVLKGALIAIPVLDIGQDALKAIDK